MGWRCQVRGGGTCERDCELQCGSRLARGSVDVAIGLGRSNETLKSQPLLPAPDPEVPIPGPFISTLSFLCLHRINNHM